MLTLTVLEGPDTGTVFTFSDETIVIGRISDCNVMLHDATVSALHCEIRREDNRFVLHARKSRNGTFINEQKERVDTHVLRNADRIRVGRSCLQVTLPEESSQEPSTTQPPKQDTSEGEDANDRTKMQSPAVPPPGVLSLPADNELRVKLHIVDGPGTGSTFEPPATTTRFTVGRSPAVDFTLTDKAVSRTHFAIEITPTGVFLIDEGSLNGTFVRGERVSRCELHDGEEIRVCSTRIQVHITSLSDQAVNGTKGAALTTPALEAPPLGEPPFPGSISQQRQRASVLPARIQLHTALLLILPVALATGALLAWDKPTLLAPAPLSSSHASSERACANCHPPWGLRSMETTCGAVDCHNNVLRVNTHIQDQCMRCHAEHRGRLFRIRGKEAQCWECHKATFQTRPMARLVEAQRAGLGNSSSTETGLRFGHAIHARDSRVENCLLCHQPLPGEIINALAPASAFPSHDECIDCHGEVGDRDPRVATRVTTAACTKCHTRDDYKVTHEPRPFGYVGFSHNDHKAECLTCHGTVSTQRQYASGKRSGLYPLPMEACTACHNQQGVTTSCIACHRSHHNSIAPAPTTGTQLEHLGLPTALLLLCVMSIGVGAYVYLHQRQPRD